MKLSRALWDEENHEKICLRRFSVPEKKLPLAGDPRFFVRKWKSFRPAASLVPPSNSFEPQHFLLAVGDLETHTPAD